MRKGLLVGIGAALALAALGATDASACSRRSSDCNGYGPPVAYQYAPPGYGYGYGYGPPAYYGPPAASSYGYAPPAYGFYGDAAYGGGRGYRGCDRGDGDGYGYTYSYAPPGGYDSYRPAAVWVPVR